MALVDEFERTGNRLFRWRSYLPLARRALFLVAMRDYHYLGNSHTLDHIWEAFCLSVSFFGLVIRAATVGHTPRETSGRNTHRQVAKSLNTTGMYSIVRNPLYLGNFFMGLGIALFAHFWWLALIYTLVFWLYYERIIFAEEAFLTREFGDEYRNWAAVTPAMVPRVRLYKRAALPFSLRNVLRREYNGFFAVILVMYLFEVVGDIVVEGHVDFDWGWAVLVGVGFTVWAILRTLKKHTKLLSVDGRA